MSINAIDNVNNRKKRAEKLQKKIKRDYQTALNKGFKKFEAKKKVAKKNHVTVQWVYESLKTA